LSRADVEAPALRTYPYRKHIGDPGSYWVTGQRAADILGVNMARVRQRSYKGWCWLSCTLTGRLCTAGSS
jgi:hypothetical protein